VAYGVALGCQMRVTPSPRLGSSAPHPHWYALRREPYYHKLQYSKTPKYDPMAAFLGAAFGALVSYLALGSFGTGGSDLSDLTVVVWYSILWLYTLKLLVRVYAYAYSSGLGFFRVWFHTCLFCAHAVYATLLYVGTCAAFLVQDVSARLLRRP